jgi:hypothetical protein
MGSPSVDRANEVTIVVDRANKVAMIVDDAQDHRGPCHGSVPPC